MIIMNNCGFGFECVDTMRAYCLRAACMVPSLGLRGLGLKQEVFIVG